MKKFDVVLCHGPFGVSTPDELIRVRDPYDRFVHGSLGRGSLDSATIQHTLASLADPGRAILLLPYGFLFRGGADQRLRQVLVESGVIRAVIGLPARTFLPSSPMETALIVLAKGGSQPRKILFVDASGLGSKARGRVSLDADDIERISAYVREPEHVSSTPEAPLFHSFRTLEQVAKQESSLQPRRHIESRVDERLAVSEIRSRLTEAEDAYRKASDEMDEIIQRLDKD